MIEEYGIKDMNDVHEFVKMLTAETIQAALDAELGSELGYSRYDYKNKQTDNSRNGYSKKTVQSNTGEIEIKVPRDRQGEYEPQLVKRHQSDVSSIEDKVIFLYSQGISTRDIQKTMQEMYGIDVDDSRVPKITDKILPLIKEWQERPLQNVYAMMILDAVHYNVRDNGIVTKKAAYVAIGTDLDGKKDVLSIWLGASESSKYWLSVFNSLKSRGVQDILIASVDGLSGFVEAINAAFPKTEVQRCIIHQIRSSTRYVSYKDIKQGALMLNRLGVSPQITSPNLYFTRRVFLSLICTATGADIRSQDTMTLAVERGWIIGFTNGTLRPSDYLIRAQAATILNRVFRQGDAQAKDGRSFADIPQTHWANDAISRASATSTIRL